MEPFLGYAAITSIFAAGAAWAGVKVSLNGTKLRVEETHTRLADHIRDEGLADMHTHDRIAKTHERLTRVETKVDMLLEKMT
jgi:hypothetical protein